MGGEQLYIRLLVIQLLPNPSVKYEDGRAKRHQTACRTVLTVQSLDKGISPVTICSLQRAD